VLGGDGEIQVKDIWEALKALLPLFGREGDRLVVESSFKQAALRYFSALTLLSIVIWALGKLQLAPVLIRPIILYGFELDTKVIATVSYGVFYSCVAIVWAAAFIGSSAILRGKPDGRLVITLGISAMALVLTGLAVSLVVFGIVYSVVKSFAALHVAGVLIIALFPYCFARLALWLQQSYSLSGTVASVASSLLCLLLLLSHYLILMVIS
jgi:hypothetical protein